jgi:hypothetical protein
MLPALPLAPVDLGAALLASLVPVLLWPRAGLAVHTGLLAYAMAMDQTRLQPYVVSLVLLLWATVPGPGPALVGRAHLVALWTWAGIHKLQSPWFLEQFGPRLGATVVPWAPTWLPRGGAYALAVTELTLGALAVHPRTRRLAAGLACLLHAGILLTLASLPRGRNVAVWPWNLALAFAGLALLLPWRESVVESLRPAGPAARVLAVLLLVFPAGFYVGLVDTYLAHNLYSAQSPRVTTSSVSFAATARAFRVILPPEPRLYVQYFRLRCRPGDTLRIDAPRAGRRWRGQGERVVPCQPERQPSTVRD